MRSLACVSKRLLEEDDKAATLARALTYQMLAYSSQVIPEIADLPSSIDNALCWGFMNEIGPFEIWDALGVADAAEKMRAEGFEPAAWVDEMLAAGIQDLLPVSGQISRSGSTTRLRRNTNPLRNRRESSPCQPCTSTKR